MRMRDAVVIGVVIAFTQFIIGMMIWFGGVYLFVHYLQNNDALHFKRFMENLDKPESYAPSTELQTPARLQCSGEAGTRSQHSDKSTSITFSNDMHQPVKLYWLSFSGSRKFYATIEPGKTLNQLTFVTHPWVVTDSEDQCMKIIFPDSEPRAVSIERKK